MVARLPKVTSRSASVRVSVLPLVRCSFSTLRNRNGLNGGVISFIGVSEIPDPITVLMGGNYAFNRGILQYCWGRNDYLGRNSF